MSGATDDPRGFLARSLASGRIHSAYLLAGSSDAPRELALWFARGLVCRGEPPQPCGSCRDCVRSNPREEIALDGSGKSGPLYRHVGDHPDLFWVERGGDDTRVRIGQIRATQSALRLGASEGGRRAIVIADADWLNHGAQNALLKLLEEPPPDTTLVLACENASTLLATVRSRCQRIRFRDERPDPLADPENAEIVERLAALARADVPTLLDWAEEFRGPRAAAAPLLEEWLALAAAWLRRRVGERVEIGRTVRGELGAARTLSECRRDLVQRNANPQMVAERALLALPSGLRG